MVTKTIQDEHLQHLETCAHCGKKLPVELIDIQGSAIIGVFCKHCKSITVLKVDQ